MDTFTVDIFTEHFPKHFDCKAPEIPEYENIGVTVLGQITSSSFLLLQVDKRPLRAKFKTQGANVVLCPSKHFIICQQLAEQNNRKTA